MADNFNRILDVLMLTQDILGDTKPVTFDSGINKHDFDFNYDENEKEKQERHQKDIHIIHASVARPVILDDIIYIFANMQEQLDELNTGRSYFCDAIKYDVNKDIYRIHWGS